jgi:segregation and condensation protein A
MNFRVDLDIFRGPLDLLLYLVQKHEIDVADVPLAPIADQFLQFLEVLSELNINEVGDFVEMASTLIEIKSRMVLPRAGEEVEEIDEAREQLVERLLEYKQFKDAASMLEDRGRRWQQRYTRLADDLPPRKIDPAEQPIHDVELWDLVSAFGRVMRENAAVQPPTIIYDDTPIQVYMQRIHERIVSHGRASFSDMFQPGMHKSAMIGVFLAILELVRHHRVDAEQDGVHGEIWITPGEEFDPSLNLTDVESYGG